MSSCRRRLLRKAKYLITKILRASGKHSNKAKALLRRRKALRRKQRRVAREMRAVRRELARNHRALAREMKAALPHLWKELIRTVKKLNMVQ